MLLLALPPEVICCVVEHLDVCTFCRLVAASASVRDWLCAAPLRLWSDLRCSGQAARVVDAPGLLALLRHAGARLCALDLHGCTKLTAATIDGILHSTQMQTVVRSLGLGGARFVAPQDNSDPALTFSGLPHCHALTRLDVAGCRAVGSAAVASIAALLRSPGCRLRFLALDGCASSLAPRKKALPGVPSALPLAVLGGDQHHELGSITTIPTTVPAVGLLELGLSGYSQLQDSSVARSIPRGSALRVLRLGGSDVLQLRHDGAAEAALWQCGGQQLTALDLSLCSQLDAAMLRQLLDRLPHLQRLNLLGCKTLTDEVALQVNNLIR